MTMRVAAATAALAGGLCWTARWGADLAGGSPGWGEAAYWVGLVLLGLALAAVGAGLVSAVWLQGLVGVAFPLLVWSVYAVIRGDGDGIGLDGVLGVVALLAGVAVLVASRRHRARVEAARRHGAHSAR